MNSNITQIINRIIRYYVIGIVVKAIAWLVRKITSNLVTIILMLVTAWLAWLFFYTYREFVIEKVGAFWDMWTSYLDRIYNR